MKKILIVDKCLSREGGSGNSMSLVAKNLVSNYSVFYLPLVHYKIEHSLEGVDRLDFGLKLKKTSSIYFRYLIYFFIFINEIKRFDKKYGFDLILTSQSEANFVGKIYKFFNRKKNWKNKLQK